MYSFYNFHLLSLIPIISFFSYETRGHGEVPLVDRASLVVLFVIGLDGIKDNSMSITLVFIERDQQCFGLLKIRDCYLELGLGAREPSIKVLVRGCDGENSGLTLGKLVTVVRSS